MFLFWSVFAAFYIWHMLGITIGLHRLLAHRSFSCPKFVEYFWVLGAYLAFQASPIWWVTMHRAHHRHVETELDPHSPRFGIFRSFTFFAHFPNSAAYPAHIDATKQSTDLMSDPVYRWLERSEYRTWYGQYALNALINIGFRLFLWLCFGPVVALASLVAAVIAFNVSLGFNILSHIPALGSKNFVGGADESVNIWWFSLLTMGEAWHNNHHEYPGCARAGLRPHEIDISWQVLKVMRRLKLAGNFNERFQLPEQRTAVQVPAYDKSVLD